MNRDRLFFLFVLFVPWCAHLSHAQETAPFPITPPTAPADSPRKFHVLHGFEMQLLAAEPLVTDPVAIAYDETGRAYVAEMNDYPYTDKAAHQPSQENPTDAPIGKIRLLVDDDNDGVFDRSTIFADELSWPTGVACWQGGVYVTATPHLWYFKDTDDDGVADLRRIVYTGFRKLNVQAVVNNPAWGIDNHLYISGSTNGGTITKPDDPDADALNMSRHDLRFDPLTETLELESGYGRFGNTFDDYGNRFVCNIRNPAIQVVLPKRYLDRNPWLPPMDPRQDICEFGDFIEVFRRSPVEAWRAERAERWAAEEPDRHPATELVGGGAVTSSAGITVYRGDAYPDEYRGQIFVGDASSNLFYRLTVDAHGATFKAGRADTGVDFCASEDVWSRLVNFVNAPDGTLHVADMYREAIEHPWSIPDDLHARIDLERGRDQGRLYRLAPPGFQRRPTPNLGELDSEELVTLLEHRNAWHRETAHRLLLERQDAAAVPMLRALVTDSRSELARIHALSVLAGMNALTALDLAGRAPDESHHLRRHALRLVERIQPDSNASKAALAPAAAALESKEPTLRFQAALALSTDPAFASQASVIKALATAARKAGGDPWLEASLLVVAPTDSASLLVEILREGASPGFTEKLAYAIGMRNLQDAVAASMTALGQHLSAPPERIVPAAAGLAEGMRKHGRKLFAVADENGAAPGFEDRLLRVARTLALAPEQALALRATALTLFRSAPFAQAVALYADLLTPESPAHLQAAVIRSLAAFAKPQVHETLLAAWPRLSPELRQQALDVLLTRPLHLPPLLDALKAGTVSPHLITRARRDLLVDHADAAIAARAQELFTDDRRPRAEVIQGYLAAMKDLTPDPSAGKLIHQTLCAACHKHQGEGAGLLGPDLATVRAWDREQLLTNILDPNREISPAFIEYLVEKTDGTVLSGAILNETEAAVLLRRPDGTRQYISRRDIAKLTNSNFSLMPEGLEAVVTPQQLTDLIAFLTQP